MKNTAINIRYSYLANSSCCLSCGGAFNYASPEPDEICVDLGSGRGTDVFKMAEKIGEKGFAYGIDISGGMLEKARTLAKRFDIKNVCFIQNDLEKISLPDFSADLIISNCTLNHVSDKEAAWKEVYRILKKGGRFVVSDIYAAAPVPEQYRNNPEAVAECWAGAVTRDEYFNILCSAGFNEVEILEESAPYVKGKTEVVSITIKGFKSI